MREGDRGRNEREEGKSARARETGRKQEQERYEESAVGIAKEGEQGRERERV